MKPGNIYIFPTSVQATIEWVVVKRHPDDQNLFLVVPSDDFPFVGPADVPMTELFTARCGLSTWIPLERFTKGHLVGRVTDHAVASIRSVLAAMARGKPLPKTRWGVTAHKAVSGEVNPGYSAWLDELAVAVRELSEGIRSPAEELEILRVSVARIAQAMLVETDQLPVLNKSYNELVEMVKKPRGWNALCAAIIDHYEKIPGY